MTSSLANNSRAGNDQLFGAPQYLKAAYSSNVPLEGQISRTQSFASLAAGAANTLLADGSNSLVIAANLAAGNITCSPALQDLYNLVGRKMDIVFIPSNDGGVRTLSIILPAGFLYAYSGAASPLVTDTMTFPVTLASSISLTFVGGNGVPNIVQVTGDVTGFTFL